MDDDGLQEKQYNMKRSVLIILCALLNILSVWAYDFKKGGIYYNRIIGTDQVEVTSGSVKYSGSVVIPAMVEYNGDVCRVSSIGGFAFAYCRGLTMVTIPEGVTSIKANAFSGCSGLMSVEWNAVSCQDFDNDPYSNPPFRDCENITSIAFGNRVEHIPANLCYGMKLTSVTIPKSVTSIGYSAFEDCRGLRSVTISEGVTSIEANAFSGCNGLRSVTIPESVDTIWRYAFYGTAISTPLYNSKVFAYLPQNYSGEYAIPSGIQSIASGAFADCGDLTSVTIPDGVTYIGSAAFEGCSGLISVTIPNSVTAIGDEAFYGCSGLTSVTIPKSVVSIGYSAFRECSGLTLVTIPEGVPSISFRVFYGCSGLRSVTIPESVTSIGNYAFENCSGLRSVTIPESVTSIGKSAFSNCSGLKSVTIPEGVTSIGEEAFSHCSVLTSVTIPESVTTIGGFAFYGTAISSPLYNSRVFAYLPQSYSGEYPISSGIQSIAGGAFRGCSGLRSVTIPEGVTSIEDCTFLGCSGLRLVTIPNSVTSIGDDAFRGCSSLTSVMLNSVTSIGRRAFSGCSGLTSVTISNSVTSIEEDAFKGCSALSSVTIPESVTKNLRTELMEYFYPSGEFSYVNNDRKLFATYVIDGDVLKENHSILNNGKITTTGAVAHRLSIKSMMYGTRLAIVSRQQIYRSIIRDGQDYDEILLFVLPPDKGKFVWTETVKGEIYTCIARFTDISFWRNGEKLYRKAVKISKSTRLDNGEEINDWSYWVKGLSKLATYGYWGNPNHITCIEKSLMVDIDKPIIEIDK